MNTHPWYKMNPAEFAKEVRGLNAEQIGAFIILSNLLHTYEGELERDDRELAGLLKVSIRKAKALTNELIERGLITISDEKRGTFLRRNEAETKPKRTRNEAENTPPPNKNNGLEGVDIEEDIDKEKKYTKKDYQLCVSEWNSFAKKYGLAGVQKLTRQRQAKLNARLHDCGGVDGWKIALEKISQSGFLLGRNNRNWRASFDFLLSEEKFTRLMEGGYDGNTESKSNITELTNYLQENGYLGDAEEETACGSFG